MQRTAKSKGLLLSKAVEGFILACRGRRLSEHTITDYSRTLKKFVAHVGDLYLKEITSAQVSEFLAAQPFSAKTVLNYHIGLAALWTWAIKQEYTEKHIMRAVDKPRPQQIVIAPFTSTEIRAMMSGLRQNEERDRSILLILLDTGIRASELCNLHRNDIDLVNRHLKVLGKGNKERFLPLSPKTASLIFKYLASCGDEPYPYEMTRTNLAHLVSAIGQRAGISGSVHPHRFRHTFAITYLRNGGDPYTLQKILGHSTMEMVKHYLSIAQVDIESAHKRASPVENWKL